MWLSRRRTVPVWASRAAIASALTQRYTHIRARHDRPAIIKIALLPFANDQAFCRINLDVTLTQQRKQIYVDPVANEKSDSAGHAAGE
jgi:hypothetical protein